MQRHCSIDADEHDSSNTESCAEPSDRGGLILPSAPAIEDRLVQHLHAPSAAEPQGARRLAGYVASERGQPPQPGALRTLAGRAAGLTS